MGVYKRGKYWIVQFNQNRSTYTRSSKSTRKRDELERQIRQQLVEIQVLVSTSNCMKPVKPCSAPAKTPVRAAHW